MQSNLKAIHLTAWGMILLGGLLFCSKSAFSNARVGSISHSEGFNFLTKQGIAAIPFEDLKEGLLAVADKKIDAFVLNEQILRHVVKGEFPGRVQVLTETFDEYFVSIALQEKSPLRKPTNKALLKFMGTQKWAELMNRNMK